MLRWLYIQLIWLHPAPFRWRFGNDMLDDFDRSALRARPRYFADAVASLARQWLLRPEFRAESMAVAANVSPETLGVPLFQTIEDYKPHPAALLQGGLLAILSISLALQRPGLLPIHRNSMTGPDLNTTVKLRRNPFEAWLKLARPYFASMPVLGALDDDRDLMLSPWEISTAPAALRQLDVNHDGKLTPQECGLQVDPNSVPPALPAQLHRRFMSYHPVLAALDADHDGEISAWEIEHAATSLRKLDHNLDGHLTADELIPPEMAVHAGLR
jgi:hypothetical protein